MKSHILYVESRQHDDWRPPAGLDRGSPRLTVLTGLGKALVILAVLLAAAGAAAGVAIGLSAARDARDARLLSAEGEITDARVIRIWRGRDEKKQPWIAFSFRFDGREFTRNAKVPLQLYSRLDAGSSLAVRFAPSRPELNHIQELGFRQTPWWVAGLVPLPFWAGCFVIVMALRSQRGLLEYGRAAAATITRHGSKEKEGMKFHYEYRLLSGAVRSGSAGPVKTPPPVGTRITVIYDADNPRRSTVYPSASPVAKLVRG